MSRYIGTLADFGDVPMFLVFRSHHWGFYGLCIDSSGHIESFIILFGSPLS